MGNSTSSDSWLDSIFQGKTASNLEAEIKIYLQWPTDSCGRLIIHHTRGSISALTIRTRMCWRNWLLHDYCKKWLLLLYALLISYLRKKGVFIVF